MRRTLGFLLIIAIGACKDGEADRAPQQVDASQLYNSAGEVALTDGGSLEYTITSEKYRQWYTAHHGLDRRIASRFGALLQPASPSERSIDRAVQYLTGEPQARDAIQRAGMSIREFVVTTVALEQEMRVATETRQDTMPLAVPYPSPLDSAYPTTAYPTPYPPPAYPTPYPAYPQPYPATSAYPPPAQLDTTRRVDTVFLPNVPARRDTAPTDWEILSRRRDTVTPATPRDSSVRRPDTILPRRDPTPTRRDSVVRDSIIRSLFPKRDTLARRDTTRPPRDTVRDTLPRPPR